VTRTLYDAAFFRAWGVTNDAYRRGCHAVAEEIHRLLRPTHVVDWGCGAGLHAERFSALGVGTTAIDWVLAPEEARAPGVGIAVLDLGSIPPADPIPHHADLAICLDVLEHVAPEHEDTALANVTTRVRTVVLSCAPPGQRGTGHVNERPRRHWIERMRAHGFAYDRRASGLLERAVRARPEVPHTWMSHHLAVYRRASAPRGDRTLQKWLASHARSSKSAARAAIREGRVCVSGVAVTRFAEPLDDGAEVTLDGRPIDRATTRVHLLLHKPRKHLSSLDPDRPDGLARYLPAGTPRVFLVGRLDYNSEGAMLVTDDGDLARRVLDPAYGVARVYRVKVRDRLDPSDPRIASLARPIRIAGRTVRASEVSFEAHRTRATWIRVVLHEGVHHEIRALCRRARLQIVKLRRESIGPVTLGDLKPRCVRPLRAEEIRELQSGTTR
jgi:23S rRNA pseudouridine2605 synthase